MPDAAENDDESVTEPTLPTSDEIRMTAHLASECSFDWRGADLTPGFLQALARAQARITTVGKDAENKDQKYRYATNDSLVGEARRALSAEGIALVSSFRVLRWTGDEVVSRRDNYVTQWIDSLVVVDFALLHGVDDGAGGQGVGRLCGFASCPAICSSGRPPDKAMFAARTSALGAIAIGVASIDRAIVAPSEDIDQRAGDEDASPRDRARRTSSRVTEREAQQVRDAIASRLKTLQAVRRAKTGTAPTYQQIIDDVMGGPFEAKDHPTALRLLEHLEIAIESNRKPGPAPADEDIPA